MRGFVATLLCGVLAMPLHAMRMDYFKSTGRGSGTKQVERSWLGQELLTKAEKPGADGLTPAGRWLVQATVAGVILTLPAVNAVAQSLLTDVMDAVDREDRKVREETGIFYLPGSPKLGAMAIFQAGEFLGMTRHPGGKQAQGPLATIVNDGRWAGGSGDELKALVSATVGVVLKSPGRETAATRSSNGDPLMLVKAPDLGMAVLTRPDGKVVDLLRDTGLTAAEKAAVMAVGVLGGKGRSDYESLGLEPETFEGVAPDIFHPERSFDSLEALGVVLKVNEGLFTPFGEGFTRDTRREISYTSFDQWRQETPEEIPADRPGIGAAFNEKGLGLIDNAVSKPVSLGGGIVTGAIKTLFGVIGMAVSAVVNVVTLGQWDLGREMMRSSVSSTWGGFRETVRFAVGIPAGIAGWVLSFSPKGSSVRSLSERLDNWSLRGRFITDDQLMGGFQHKAGARNAILHGIDNNGADTFKNEKGEVVTFQQKQAEEMVRFLDRRGSKMTLEEKRRMKEEVIPQTDFVAVYSGNPVVDILLMSFERGGLHVSSRKVMEPFLGKSYEGVYFHSAGGAVGLSYQDQMHSERKAFIGAAGMHDGWYRDIQADKIQNKGDVIPNLGPETSGDRIGAKVSVRFGGAKGEDGGIVPRQAAGVKAPAWWKFWQMVDNHNYMDYFVRDQLQRMRTPPMESGAISVKDPDFGRKVEEKVRGLGQ